MVVTWVLIVMVLFISILWLFCGMVLVACGCCCNAKNDAFLNAGKDKMLFFCVVKVVSIQKR